MEAVVMGSVKYKRCRVFLTGFLVLPTGPSPYNTRIGSLLASVLDQRRKGKVLVNSSESFVSHANSNNFWRSCSSKSCRNSQRVTL